MARSINDSVELLRTTLGDITTSLGNKGVTAEGLKAREVPDKIREIELAKYVLTITATEFEGETLTVTKDSDSVTCQVASGTATAKLKSMGMWRITGDNGDYVDVSVSSPESSATLVKKKMTLSDAVSDDTTISVHIDSTVGRNTNPDKFVLKKDGVQTEAVVDIQNPDVTMTGFEYAEGSTYTVEYVLGDEVRGSVEVEIISGSALLKRYLLLEDIDKPYPTKCVFTDQKPANKELKIVDCSHNKNNSVVEWVDGDTLYVSSRRKGVKIIYQNGADISLFGAVRRDYDTYPMVSIDLTNLDISQEDSLQDMFSHSSKLESIDMSMLDASHITSMMNMFYDCQNLTSIKLPKDISQVKYVSNMFMGCSSLQEIDLSSFANAHNIKNMSKMFQRCSSLRSIDTNYFDTSNVTDYYSIFQGCASLTTLDLSDFNMNNADDGANIFDGCTNLSKIIAQDWMAIPGLKDKLQEENSGGYRTFYQCTSLPGYSDSKISGKYATFISKGGYFTPPSS